MASSDKTSTLRDPGEGGLRLVILLIVEVRLPERKPCLDVAGAQLNRFCQMADALFNSGLNQSANVIFERIQAEIATGGEESLLIQVEIGINLHGDFPGQRILNIDQLIEIAFLLQRGPHAGTMHIQHSRGGLNAAVRDRVISEDDIIRIESLGNAIGGGLGGMKIRGQAKMLHGIAAIFATNGEKTGGAQARIEDVGKGSSNPVQTRLRGIIFKWKHPDQVTIPVGFIGRRRLRP